MAARQAMRVLVTGGAGFLGGHLVRTLCQAGHAVRVVDNLSTGERGRLTGVPVELLQADVRSLAAMRRALDGADVVFHLAALRAPHSADDDGDLQRAEEVNVRGTLNVLQAAREIRPRRVVVAGSGEVYGKAAAYLLHEEVMPQPTTLHGVQQLAIEHHVRVYRELFQVPSVLLRLFPTFGPEAQWEGPEAMLVPRLCRAALEGTSPVIVGDPRQTRDLVYVDNAVAALIAAAETPGIDGEVLNIASGEAATLGQVWSLLCELAGRKKNQLEPTYTPAPSWEVSNMRVSIARASRAIGYAPAVRLREGLRRTMDYYLARWEADPNAWFSAETVDARVAEATMSNAWFSSHAGAPGIPGGGGARSAASSSGSGTHALPSPVGRTHLSTAGATLPPVPRVPWMTTPTGAAATPGPGADDEGAHLTTTAAPLPSEGERYGGAAPTTTTSAPHEPRAATGSTASGGDGASSSSTSSTAAPLPSSPASSRPAVASGAAAALSAGAASREGSPVGPRPAAPRASMVPPARSASAAATTPLASATPAASATATPTAGATLAPTATGDGSATGTGSARPNATSPAAPPTARAATATTGAARTSPAPTPAPTATAARSTTLPPARSTTVPPIAAAPHPAPGVLAATTPGVAGATATLNARPATLPPTTTRSTPVAMPGRSVTGPVSRPPSATRTTTVPPPRTPTDAHLATLLGPRGPGAPGGRTPVELAAAAIAAGPARRRRATTGSFSTVSRAPAAAASGAHAAPRPAPAHAAPTPTPVASPEVSGPFARPVGPPASPDDHDGEISAADAFAAAAAGYVHGDEQELDWSDLLDDDGDDRRHRHPPHSGAGR